MYKDFQSTPLLPPPQGACGTVMIFSLEIPVFSFFLFSFLAAATLRKSPGVRIRRTACIGLGDPYFEIVAAVRGVYIFYFQFLVWN